MDATSDTDQENNSTVSSVKSTQERKLCYRNLLNKVESINEAEDLGIQTARDIGEIIKEVNNLEVECGINQRVEHADETLLDSMVLSSASSLLVRCAEAVDVFSSTYDPTEFANQIMQFVRGDDDEYDSRNLLKLLPDAQKNIPQVPNYCFVYGSYDLTKTPQPKPRKERQKQTKERLEKKQPEKITDVEKDEAGIDEIVKFLYDVLMEEYEKREGQPLNYYDYVVDTSSFSNTVENMFYCSFLVRDGRAHIDLDGRGTPFIKPMKKRKLKQFRDEGGSNSQMISTVTIPIWEGFKKEGLLQRHRKASQK